MFLLFSLSMLWFQPELFPDMGQLPSQCQLSVVDCTPGIKKYIREKLGDKGVAIVECESRFKADAIGYNRNGSRDFGYLQWNDRYWQHIIDDCFGQPNQLECEVGYVVDKIKRDGGWSAWSCDSKIK